MITPQPASWRLLSANQLQEHTKKFQRHYGTVSEMWNLFVTIFFYNRGVMILWCHVYRKRKIFFYFKSVTPFKLLQSLPYTTTNSCLYYYVSLCFEVQVDLQVSQHNPQRLGDLHHHYSYRV